MPDSNMLYAYFWACRVPQDMLPTSLKDVEIRAILIDKIDFPITGENNTANILLEFMTEDERQFRLERALRVADSFLTDLISEISKKSVILRLWSGCLDAAKTIATETLDGATSPERRKAAILSDRHICQMGFNLSRWSRDGTSTKEETKAILQFRWNTK